MAVRLASFDLAFFELSTSISDFRFSVFNLSDFKSGLLVSIISTLLVEFDSEVFPGDSLFAARLEDNEGRRGKASDGSCAEEIPLGGDDSEGDDAFGEVSLLEDLAFLERGLDGEA